MATRTNKKSSTPKSIAPESIDRQSINQKPVDSSSSRQTSSGEDREVPADREFMSNETLSDVNELDAFGGDRPAQDLVDDEAIQEQEDQKYNR